MTFEIDTGMGADRLPAKSDFVDAGQRVTFFGSATKAERAHRQIIETISQAETVAQLDEYLARESIVIDAIWMAYPEFAERIDEAARDHRIWITPEPVPATQYGGTDFEDF